ncbi:hypothetical protein POTOM_015022 [Populus tomentosa]|uniref:Uncharacterized protein n=1 Tax=Populus tomentosa TaxID=118781 RepID=A0A8X7ZZ64_POPTO|nr:hypothetical protein POTOM_015022 [Populus tomentosa]
MGAEIEDNGAIQIPPTRAGHIKKRALKNKAVSVSFNEKDLRCGYWSCDNLLVVVEIKGLFLRKLEKEFALHGGPPATNESDEYEEDHEESEPIASVNGTTKYDNGDMQVTVTTSEISREDKDSSSEKTQVAAPSLVEANKTHKLSVSKKKSFKKVSKRKSRSKPQKKRDRKKGKTKNKL